MRARWVALAALLLVPRAARAQPAAEAPPIARLIGVDLGTSRADLHAEARAGGVHCEEKGDAIVCRRKLIDGPVETLPTYWYKGNRLDRVFEVAQVGSDVFADWE